MYSTRWTCLRTSSIKYLIIFKYRRPLHTHTRTRTLTPPYDPLKTIQLLSETFSCKMQGNGNIWGYRLKWDTLYNEFKSTLVKYFTEFFL